MTDFFPPPQRRMACARCLRPSSACICRWIVPVATPVDLLILQHPLEVDNAKGSARLLHLSVAHSRLAIGEQFEPGDLAAWLGQPGRIPVLLYPDTPESEARGVASAPALPLPLPVAALTLVVLDGTWRKSRKMLYVNPLLHTLPRLPLREVARSHYRIRKAHAPDQLSTLEAACAALGQLEGHAGHYQGLLDSFDDFVDTYARTQGQVNRA